MGAALRQAADLHAPVQAFVASRQRHNAFMKIGRDVFPDAGFPAPCAGHAPFPVGRDIHDLPGQARYIQLGAIDNFNPDNPRRGDSPQRGFCAVRFTRDPLAIDQHIAGGLAEPARSIVVTLNGEAGDPVHHVQSCLRVILCEVARRIITPGRDRCVSGRLCHGWKYGETGCREGGKTRQ